MIRKGLLVALAAFALLCSANLFAEEDYLIINKTGVVIHELYLSASTTKNWEEDILGVDTLADGEQVKINFSHEEDACVWDLMIVDGEGNKLYWENIDLCEYTTITLHYKDGKGWAEFE